MTPDARDDIRDWYPTWSCAAKMDDCRLWYEARQARTARTSPALGAAAGRDDSARRDCVPGGLIRRDLRENEFGTWLGKPAWRPALLPMTPSLPSIAPKAWTDATVRTTSVPPRPPRRSRWLPRCWSRLRGVGLAGASAVTSVVFTGQDRSASRFEW